MTNIREEIDNYIFETLRDNSTKIRKVTRRFIGVDLDTGALQGLSQHEMPAVIVNSGNEVNDTTGPGGRVSYQYTPELVGFVHDQDEYYKELNEIITEVKKIIMQNARVGFNGDCIAEIRGIANVRIDRGRLAPLAVFAMELDVRYTYTVASGGELTL